MVATVVPMRMTSIAELPAALAPEQAEDSRDAGIRRAFVDEAQALFDDEPSVRRAPDDVRESAAAIEPELPAVSRAHALRIA